MYKNIKVAGNNRFPKKKIKMYERAIAPMHDS